jgi:hypothetical protein
LVAEEEETPSTRAGFGLRQVGGIAVDIADHGTGVKVNRGIRMRGGIVRELVGSLVAWVWLAAREPRATSMVESTARA